MHLFSVMPPFILISA